MHSRNLAIILGLASLLASCSSFEDTTRGFDIVLVEGRVMDPETGFDAVRNVGVRDGRIEAISTQALSGERVIDARGLVVAPGFIDLHVHGQSDESFSYMVRDGVTTAFELEVGTGDVARWYAEREGGQRANYGVSIGHIPVRMIVKKDEGEFLPSGPAKDEPATEEEIEEMARRLEEGLDQGAVAVGFGWAYTPAASREEIERMLQVAADHGASAHMHVKEGVAGVNEAIEAAGRAGASLHVVHANSSGGAEITEFLARIQQARRAGQDVTTEAYPYGAGQTRIESALFDDWESWDDERFGIYQWAATGERLTRETFAKYRQQGGRIIIHDRTEEMTRTAVASPLTMIASDGGIENGAGHPRSTGTFSKVLGKYVREEGVVSQEDALRRMTIAPARRLEAYVPAMRNKGRVKIGADADITLFDPETVIDTSTYIEPTLTPEGIPYVIVNGVLVVDGGELVPDAKPGRPIRVE
jgi:N-acyl-D-aspartate/D-glutamate deacylase